MSGNRVKDRLNAHLSILQKKIAWPRSYVIAASTLLVSSTLAGCALAASLAGGGATSDPAKVEGGSFAVEPNHTIVGFGVSHMGFSTYYGNFTHVAGNLHLETPNPAASLIEVHIPVNSLYVPSDALAKELKSSAWLDSEKYPEIVFKSTQVIQTSPTEAQVTGDFTLHGVTKPVTLSVKFHGSGRNPLTQKYTVGFDATARIKRSDFDVKSYLPMIGDDLDVTIAAVFERQ
jgi:polyisoprenoid-binding protein YceI